MTLSFPYALAFLSDILCTRDRVTVELRRNDELSGSGDGRYWTSRLSTPLWSARIEIGARQRHVAREINAKIRALDGSRQSFYWANPFYKPAGGLIGAGATLAAVNSDRTAVTLSGIASGGKISPGDLITIQYGSGRIYMAEIAEQVTSSGGSVGPLSVMPYVPLGVTVGSAVVIDKPYFKAFIPPDGFVPFSDRPGRQGVSASVSLLQRV